MTDSDAAIDLQSEVDRALWDVDAVRMAPQPVLAQVSLDGKVIVRGPIRSRLIRDPILDRVRAVSGVVEVIDHMVPDPELELAVAEAVERDPRTANLPPGAIQVQAFYGLVTLAGKLPAGADRSTVRSVAEAVPGVVRVYDRFT